MQEQQECSRALLVTQVVHFCKDILLDELCDQRQIIVFVLGRHSIRIEPSRRVLNTLDPAPLSPVTIKKHAVASCALRVSLRMQYLLFCLSFEKLGTNLTIPQHTNFRDVLCTRRQVGRNYVSAPKCFSWPGRTRPEFAQLREKNHKAQRCGMQKGSRLPRMKV